MRNKIIFKRQTMEKYF